MVSGRVADFLWNKMEQYDELKKLVTDIRSEMLNNDKFDELIKKIDEKESRVEELEE